MTSFSGSGDHLVTVRKSSRPAKKQNVSSTDVTDKRQGRRCGSHSELTLISSHFNFFAFALSVFSVPSVVENPRSDYRRRNGCECRSPLTLALSPTKPGARGQSEEETRLSGQSTGLATRHPWPNGYGSRPRRAIGRDRRTSPGLLRVVPGIE